MDAPQQLGGEQNLEYYSLYQKYLGIFEEQLSDYINSLGSSVNDFYRQLQDVQADASIKDKKLLHFVNYLVASTDYESFYKIMGRAAKKARKEEEAGAFADAKAFPSTVADSKGESGADSKAEGKPSSSGDSKSDSK